MTSFSPFFPHDLVQCLPLSAQLYSFTCEGHRFERLTLAEVFEEVMWC